MPKASALKSHQSNGSRLDKTLLALRKHSRVLRHRRAFADCFGANPVASALGNLARRDPNEAVRIYHEGQQPILKTGTFYLAGKRNFLFGSDKSWGRRPPGLRSAGLPACAGQAWRPILLYSVVFQFLPLNSPFIDAKSTGMPGLDCWSLSSDLYTAAKALSSIATI